MALVLLDNSLLVTAHLDTFLIEILWLFLYKMMSCATKIMLFPLKILFVNLKNLKILVCLSVSDCQNFLTQ